MTDITLDPDAEGARRRARRNVFVLALCQALYMTGTSMVITVTALAGSGIAPIKSLGTLPLSLQFIATMATTIPASLLMRKWGRRAGFLTGAAAGMLGAIVSVVALLHAHFVLFCVGAALIGVLNGFAIYYRFAAADSADPAFRAKAISLVMAGGVFAAFAGPNLANFTVDFFDNASFAGCFASLIALHSITILLLVLIDIPAPTVAERQEATTPLPVLLRRPALLVAIGAAVAGYASMNLVMTATPLAMIGHDFSFSHAAMVIQWHVFAMFAPSFFTGHIIARVGVLNVIIAGAACILVCVAINLSGDSLLHYLVALIALGLGWNFMFVGATALLTNTHDVADRAKVQGLNEFVIFGSVSLASFASGAVQQELGWFATNLLVLPVVLAALVATAWLKLSAVPAAGSTSGGK